MAYGYGSYDPKVQSAGNRPAAGSRTNTGPQASSLPSPTQNAQTPQYTSASNSPVSPTGQIAQNLGGAHPAAGATTYSWQGSPIMNQTGQAVMGALQTPMWSQDAISQMKGAQHDAAGQMMQQFQESNAQNAAAHGTLGSGAQMANDRRMEQGMASDLLGKYRDIDLQTTEANRGDMYNAIGAGQSYTSMDQGLNQAAVAMALQKMLGMEGINAQREGNRMGLAGNIFQAMLGYQNNMNGIGLGYSQLDAQQQNAMLDRLLRGGGF